MLGSFPWCVELRAHAPVALRGQRDVILALFVLGFASPNC